MTASRRDFLRSSIASVAFQRFDLGRRALSGKAAAISSVVFENIDVSRLNELFPGYMQSSTYDLLGRCTQLYRNNSGKALRAAAIRWTVEGTGRKATINTHYFSHGRRRFSTPGGRNNAIAGRRDIAGINETFLVSPICLFSQSSWARLTSTQRHEVMLKAKLKRDAGVLSKLDTGVVSDKVQGEIAGIVFRKGEYASISSLSITEQLVHRFFDGRNGSQDEAASIAGLIQSGFTLTSLTEELARRRDANLDTSAKKGLRMYGLARQKFAGRVATYLEQRGLAKTKRLVDTVQRMPRLSPRQIVL